MTLPVAGALNPVFPHLTELSSSNVGNWVPGDSLLTKRAMVNTIIEAMRA